MRCAREPQDTLARGCRGCASAWGVSSSARTPAPAHGLHCSGFAWSCSRAPPRVPCSRPCSPTRDPDRPTAHATSSRQEPATLTGPRPCYSGHVTPQALPPSAAQRSRPSAATPPRGRCGLLATLLRAPPPPRLLPGSVQRAF